MFTLWDSLEAVRAFAGDDYETAVFYPEDERFLVERDLTTTHYQVDTRRTRRRLIGAPLDAQARLAVFRKGSGLLAGGELWSWGQLLLDVGP